MTDWLTQSAAAQGITPAQLADRIAWLLDLHDLRAAVGDPRWHITWTEAA